MNTNNDLKKRILLDKYRMAGRKPGSKNIYPTKYEINQLLQISREKALEGDQIASANVLIHLLLRELERKNSDDNYI